MPEKPGIKHMKKALKEINRETGQPSMKTYRQDVFFNREDFHKLSIISVLEGEFRGKIGEMSINQYIEKYEAENGNLKKLARKYIEENEVCERCNGEREIEDRTVSTPTGYLKGPCPKCGGISK